MGKLIVEHQLARGHKMDEMEKAFKIGKMMAITWFCIVIGLIGFGMWVIIKILQHFKII
jgi:flagellar biogenesis protein FliO